MLKGVSEAGLYAYAMAATAPLFVLFNLQLPSLLLLDDKPDENWPSYITLRYSTTLGAFSLSLLVGLFAPAVEGLFPMIVAVALYRAQSAGCDLLTAKWQRELNFRRATLGAALRSGVAVAVMYTAIRQAHSVPMGIFLAAVAGMGAFFLQNLALRCIANESITRKARMAAAKPVKLLKRAIPLGGITFITSLSAQIPTLFLFSNKGESEVGVYSAVAIISTSITFFINALLQPLAPHLASTMSIDRADVIRSDCRRAAFGVMISCVAISVIVAYFGANLIDMIYGEKLKAGGALLLVNMIGVVAACTVTPIGMGVTAMNRLWLQPLAGCISLAATVLSSIVLVPRYGIVGASLSSSFGGVLCVVVFYVLLMWKSSDEIASQSRAQNSILRGNRAA